MLGLQALVILVAAALAEIAGCFAFWMWLRLGRGIVWAVPGAMLLVGFAVLLTWVPVVAAGRAYAIYGGIYIATSLVWLWLVEGTPPDSWDLAGATLSLAGAAIIFAGRQLA